MTLAIGGRPLRILLTNDDGIGASGFAALEALARELSDDLWMVAPEFEQSGVSSALSLHDPLRLREVAPRRFALRGTPTDCVLMAVHHVMPERPDLVLSGVNRGQNIAEDVIYSGTIAGAIEGCMLGIPSIALSQCYDMGEGAPPGAFSWAATERHGAAIVARLWAAGWPEEALINVNFPYSPDGEVAGVEVTAQGKRDQSNYRLDARRDARGHAYFWQGFARARSRPPEGVDLHACYHGRISVTPLHLNMTHEATRERLAEALA